MAPFDAPTLLHNPRCTKSRAAKALLDERGITYKERRYLDEPLTPAELDTLRRRLGRPAREWVRTGEDAFKEAGLGGQPKDNLKDEVILAAMARFPILIERPILILDDRAVVGRPPERVIRLLDDEL
jgi:arsenate reductase (glutaredoxin)